MRHATVNSTLVIFDWHPRRAGMHDRRACDWAPIMDLVAPFCDSTALDLLTGEKVDLPTCPACAALVDLALEMRGSGARGPTSTTGRRCGSRAKVMDSQND